MEIVPLNRKVLLKPIEEPTKESKTKGGIYLAEKESFEANRAQVVALGEKVELKLKKNDTVIYEDLGADKVNDMVLVDENKIIALLK